MIYLLHAPLYPLTKWVEVGHTHSYHPQTNRIQGPFHYFLKLQIKKCMAETWIMYTLNHNKFAVVACAKSIVILKQITFKNLLNIILQYLVGKQ